MLILAPKNRKIFKKAQKGEVSNYEPFCRSNACGYEKWYLSGNRNGYMLTVNNRTENKIVGQGQ